MRYDVTFADLPIPQLLLGQLAMAFGKWHLNVADCHVRLS